LADSPFHILMVDDVTRYQTLYETSITDAMPARVSFATNGEEALQVLDSRAKFDLLILDLNMPKLGGEQTLREIRKNPEFDTMPVIILTGDSAPSTQKRLLDLGADDFIEKGAPPEIFVARLKSLLRYKLALDRLTRIAVDMDIFAAGVLHDIRNLEANINAVCDITKMTFEKKGEIDSAQMARDFELLEAKGHGLAKYASEIIEMVRETHAEITLVPIDLKELLNWVLTMIKSENEATELHTKIKEPFIDFIADNNFLRLALLNIIQNAHKYRRENEPAQITVQTKPSASNPDTHSLICIRDFGKGVKTGEHRKIFKPFVRGTDEAKGTGFGLGLSLVTKVVSSMNGRVWAEPPESGFGTVFCIELPHAKRSL